MRNIRKATCNKTLEDKSKDRDSIFWQFSSDKALTQKYWERRRDDTLMLSTIRDDTWNVLNVQHIILNDKIIQTSLVGAWQITPNGKGMIWLGTL